MEQDYIGKHQTRQILNISTEHFSAETLILIIPLFMKIYNSFQYMYAKKIY